MRCSAQLTTIIIQHFENSPPWIFAYTDGRTKQQVDTVFVKMCYISMFLQHDTDEILVTCKAAELSL